MGPKSRTVKFYSTVSDRSEVVHLIARLFNSDGGPGSGNFGHKGRPGMVGGSGPGGGSKGTSGGSESSYVFGIKAETEKKPVRIKIDPNNQKMVSAPLNMGGTSSQKKSFNLHKNVVKAALKNLKEREVHLQNMIEVFGEKSAYKNELEEINRKIKELEEPEETPEMIENRLIDKQEEYERNEEKAFKIRQEIARHANEEMNKAYESGDPAKVEEWVKRRDELHEMLKEVSNENMKIAAEKVELEKKLKELNPPKIEERSEQGAGEGSILSLENKREELTRRGNELRHRMRYLSKEENELYSRRNEDLSDEERKEIVKRIDEVSEDKNAIRKEYQSIDVQINDLDSQISGLERTEPLESVEERINHKEKKHDELLDEEDDLYHKMQSIGAAIIDARNAHDHKAVEELEEEYERIKDLWYDVKDIRAENELKIASLKEIRRTKIGQREREEIERLGKTEAEYRREKALEHFGTTDNWHEAGWILPDGQLLNFSGEKDYHPGERGFDHREIGQIYPEFGSYNTQGMQRFRADGNVRFYPESPGVNVGTKEPTQEQYDEIARIALDAIDETGFFIVDFSTKDNSMFGSLRYAVNPEDAGIDGVQAFDDPYEVINDIRHYFETGEITEEFGTPHFRGDAMPKQLAEDGGPGSGNHGHSGRPGKVGGSGPGGGSGGKTNTESSTSSSKGTSYWDLKDPTPEEAANFDIWKFVEEENKRQEEEKKAKEGSFNESAEKGVEGLSKTYHMKGIVEAAKAAKGDYHAFVYGLTGSQKDALREQYRETKSEEGFVDYVKRIQSMLAAKEYIPEPVNKPVDGKDITATYEYKGSNDFSKTASDKIDTVIEDVIHQQGFDGIPKVIPKEEFDKITNEHPEMPLLYRSFTAADAEMLKTYNQQLESGFWYVDCGNGGAQYGQGMYAVGVFTEEPVTIDNVTDAFREFGFDFLKDEKGDYWEMETEMYVKEVNPDFFYEPGMSYLFSDPGSNEGHFFELVDMSDDGFGLQWLDRSTGEMHDFEWVTPERFDMVRECTRSTKEDAYRRDLRYAYSEMRHYRGGAEYASTREMTLDPSAKIISYNEALDIMDGDLTKEEKQEYYKKELEKFREQLNEKYGEGDNPEKFLEEYEFKSCFGLNDKDDWWKYESACKKVDADTQAKRLLDGSRAGRRAYEQFKLDTAEVRRERKKRFERLGGDVGVCMAALGYDAINAWGHGETGSYMVVLNRTKVILSDQEVDPYH